MRGPRYRRFGNSGRTGSGTKWMFQSQIWSPTIMHTLEAAQVAVQQWRLAKDQLTTSGIRLRRALRTLVQESRQRLRVIEQHECFRRPLDRINDLRQLLDDRQRALSLAVGQRLRTMQRRLNDAAVRLDQQRPAVVLARTRQRLGDAQLALSQAIARRLGAFQQRLFTLASALRERHPRHLILLQTQRLRNIESRLGRTMLQDQRRRAMRLEALAAQLGALDPQKVLARGYSLTTLKRTKCWCVKPPNCGRETGFSRAWRMGAWNPWSRILHRDYSLSRGAMRGTDQPTVVAIIRPRRSRPT